VEKPNWDKPFGNYDTTLRLLAETAGHRYDTGQEQRSSEMRRGLASIFIVAAVLLPTKSERYGWLNGVQAVGKMLELKGGDGAHVMHDILVVR
jgi:hypothetical protein